MYKIGIDAGTTVTKLAAINDGKVTDLLRINSNPTDSDIFALYHKLVQLHELTTDDIECINLTGVGATGFIQKFDTITPSYIHEFDANVAGARFISGNSNNFLLISLGTGTSYIHVKDSIASHLGGLGLGGGTVRGLSKYLVNTTDVKRLADFANSGDLKKINLTIGDVSKEKFEGLMDNITASNFGKADNDASSADIVRGIYSLVLENAIQTGCMLANQIGVSSIVLIGGLCNSDELPKHLDTFRQMYPNLNFITAKNGSYITAIGTAVGLQDTNKS